MGRTNKERQDARERFESKKLRSHKRNKRQLIEDEVDEEFEEYLEQYKYPDQK